MNTLITVGGSGERMSGLSPRPKHELYYGNKKIIEHLLERFPRAKVIGWRGTRSRRETLLEASGMGECLIIDCDIYIPPDFSLPTLRGENWILVFISEESKYGSVAVNESGMAIDVIERGVNSNVKCSGVYYTADIDELIEKMQNENSVGKAACPCAVFFENSIVRLGDRQDYMRAIKKFTHD